jgi:hypothetical protein
VEAHDACDGDISESHRSWEDDVGKRFRCEGCGEEFVLDPVGVKMINRLRALSKDA